MLTTTNGVHTHDCIVCTCLGYSTSCSNNNHIARKVPFGMLVRRRNRNTPLSWSTPTLVCWSSIKTGGRSCSHKEVLNAVRASRKAHLGTPAVIGTPPTTAYNYLTPGEANSSMGGPAAPYCLITGLLLLFSLLEEGRPRVLLPCPLDKEQ